MFYPIPSAVYACFLWQPGGVTRKRRDQVPSQTNCGPLGRTGTVSRVRVMSATLLFAKIRGFTLSIPTLLVVPRIIWLLP